MMDIAKSETFKNFIILNKALLFLIKLSKTAVQSVPKFVFVVNFIEFCKLFSSQTRPQNKYILNFICSPLLSEKFISFLHVQTNEENFYGSLITEN